MSEGWLGEVFEVHTAMSRWDDDDCRRYPGRLPGGAMHNFDSHLVGLVTARLERPANVVFRQKAPRDDELKDNRLAVLEYRRVAATVRPTERASPRDQR